MKTVQLTAQIDDNAQIDALKAFMTALHIPFEIEEQTTEYSSEFTKKLQKSVQQAKNGEVKKLDLDDIWPL